MVPNSLPRPNERCETCRFFVRGNGDEGVCRRYPPQVVKNTEVEGHWPMLSMDAWCGEYATRAAA